MKMQTFLIFLNGQLKKDSRTWSLGFIYLGEADTRIWDPIHL